ncbi:MAG: FadR family transcriptional regulator [Firmicutes bacterium]|nr:FadR family transcriptional regulator [Bacillota bacterium]
MQVKKKGNLSQRTADALREDINAKKYGAGEKLPNENELSVALGVSRTTLREAIRILVNEGVLVVHRGRGTFVAKAIEHFAAGQDLPGMESADIKVTLRDLFEARMIIEPEAAVLAAMRASEEEIEEILRLGEIVQQHILEDPRGNARIESETAFHGALMRASHNEFLTQFISVMTLTIEKTFDLNMNLDTIAEDAYKDHILIMDSLRRRDASALRSAITIHLHHAAWNEDLQLDL